MTSRVIREVLRHQICWWVALGLVAATAVFVCADDGGYVSKTDGQFSKPVYRRLELSPSPPVDLEVSLDRPSGKLQFAEWRYGSDSSTRVAIAVRTIETPAAKCELFVDADRDRRIDESERIDGGDTVFELKLAAEWVGVDSSDFADRRVRVKWGEGHLDVGTLGYVSQQVSLGRRTVSTRLVDGNANGLCTDGQDRLWIDLDGDGKWSPFREQFPVRPIITLQGTRYTMRVTPLEQLPLSLSENRDVGQLQLLLPCLDGKPNVELRLLEVMLTTQDGAAYTIHGLQPVTLPGGRYRIGAVRVSTMDSRHPEPLNFVFAGAGAKGEREFHVRPDVLTQVDVMGSLRFELEVRRAAKTGRNIETLWIDPRLYTEDDLLITACWRGPIDRLAANVSSNPARIAAHVDGVEVDSTQSGFA
ncbi:MAG: hypothetical protein KDA60_15055 [Planctomycetales bacterium]|nr:hypothetical protein [Planctomycetales bacterium]